MSPSSDIHDDQGIDTQALGFELSNELLSDREEAIVRRVLSEEQDEIMAIENELSRLEAAIVHLKERRTKHLTRVERLRVGLAPHKKLPAELLARIFEAAAEFGPMHQQSFGRHSMQFVYGHVCSRWRAISMADPHLWRNIDLQCNFSLWEERNTLHMANDILSRRGGSAPVTLFAHLVCKSDWGAMLGLISTYSLRIRGLQLSIGATVSSCLSIPRSNFRLLESVTINLKNSYVTKAEEFLIAAFSTSINLNSLTISRPSQSARGVKEISLAPNISSPAARFPWKKLTTLSITGRVRLPLTEISEILRQAKNLVVFEVEVSRSAADLLGVRRTRLPGLRELHINGGGKAILKLLPVLYAPCLELLHLEPKKWSERLCQGIVQFINRMGGNIRIFMVPNRPLPPDNVCSLMRCMPMLRRLEVYMQDFITVSLLSTINEEELCPCLRKCHGFAIETTGAAVDFLRSRWKAAPEGFRDVEFKIGGDRSEDSSNLDFIRSAVENGRNIKFVAV